VATGPNIEAKVRFYIIISGIMIETLLLIWVLNVLKANKPVVQPAAHNFPLCKHLGTKPCEPQCGLVFAHGQCGPWKLEEANK
jgi:hypothetical protein